MISKPKAGQAPRSMQQCFEGVCLAARLPGCLVLMVALNAHHLAALKCRDVAIKAFATLTSKHGHRVHISSRANSYEWHSWRQQQL